MIEFAPPVPTFQVWTPPNGDRAPLVFENTSSGCSVRIRVSGLAETDPAFQCWIMSKAEFRAIAELLGHD